METDNTWREQLSQEHLVPFDPKHVECVARVFKRFWFVGLLSEAKIKDGCFKLRLTPILRFTPIVPVRFSEWGDALLTDGAHADTKAEAQLPFCIHNCEAVSWHGQPPDLLAIEFKDGDALGNAILSRREQDINDIRHFIEKNTAQ